MKVILTGGGTAGHVLPAINIGQYLKTNHKMELLFIGNDDFIEEKIAKENNIKFISIDSQGLEGENFFNKYIKFGIKNIKGIKQALSIIKKEKPDIVVATGGFVSFPVIVAAKIKRIPIFVHEQNTVMGKVNKIATKWATTIFHSFPIEQGNNIKIVGNPVRFKEKLEKNGDKLVFLGGSGGSIKLNETAVKYAKNYPTINCVLVSGEKFYKKVKEKELPKNLEVIPFTNEMLHIYQQAKVIVARSGAGVMFEIANLSIPAIFVPLPTSADNHQKKNAEFFTEKNASKLIEQGENFYSELEIEIANLWNNEAIRNELKENLEFFTTRECEKEITKKILEKIKQLR